MQDRSLLPNGSPRSAVRKNMHGQYVRRDERYTERSARNDRGYFGVSSLSLIVSLGSAMVQNLEVLRFATAFGAITCAYMLIWDAVALVRGKRNVGRLVLLFGILFWFWIDAIFMAWSHPAFPNPGVHFPLFLNTVPLAIVSYGLICVNLFTWAVVVSWSVLPVPVSIAQHLTNRTDRLPGKTLEIAGLAIVVVAWIPLMLAHSVGPSGALDILMGMRSNSGELGGINQVGFSLVTFLFGVMSGAWAFSRILLNASSSKALSWLTVALVLPLVILGAASRFMAAYLLMPGILLALALGFDGRQRGARLLRRQFAVAVVILAAAVSFQAAYRTQGLGTAPPLELRGTGGFGALQSLYLGAGHFGPLLMSIEFIKQRGAPFTQFQLPFFISHFVPRALWPDKPYPIAWEEYNSIVTQNYRYNVTPSIIGQYYMNWMYFGVICAGLMMGWLGKMSSGWIYMRMYGRSIAGITVGGMMLTFVFLSFRIFYPLYFAYPLFGAILCLGLTSRVRSPLGGR